MLFTRKLLPARTRAERNERGGVCVARPLSAHWNPLRPESHYNRLKRGVADTLGAAGKEERGSGKRSALSSAQASGLRDKREETKMGSLHPSYTPML